MATQAQIKANRLNAQKSTGPKTAEGRAAVAQNAVKHGLFAQQNVVNCEKVSDFDEFCTALFAGLAPVGAVEMMMADRIVSLSWRLKRVERMHSEAIDVLIARAETDYWQNNRRNDARSAHDPRAGGLELILGWATVHDFSESKVLERLLMYEKRIESSLYKAMSELQKTQRARKEEKEENDRAQMEVITTSVNERASTQNKANQDPAAPQSGRDVHRTQGRDALATEEGANGSLADGAECAEQSQIVRDENSAKRVAEEDYDDNRATISSGMSKFA